MTKRGAAQAAPERTTTMTTYTPKFDEAHDRMRMLRDSAVSLGYSECGSVWDSLTGRDPENATELAESVMMTLPEEHATLMRLAGGVPAAVYIAMLGRLSRAVKTASQSYELRDIARQAWKQFDERVQLADNIQTGTGWDLSDAWHTTVDICDDHRWARNKVTKIAKLAGRMYEVLQGVRRMVPDGAPQEVKAVTLGGDIERLMPGEHALLANPLTRDMKSMDVLQSKALQVEVAGEKPAGRGPLVLCVDESYSMDGDRNIWAKACAVALTRVAHEENRMVHVVHFSTGSIVRHVAPKDRTAVLDMMSCFTAGGTDIGPALVAGDQQVKTLDKSGHTGADVVMITDGTDHREEMQANAIASMKSKGVRLWTIGIAVNIPENRALRKEASHYIHIDGNSQDPGSVKGLARAARGEQIR